MQFDLCDTEDHCHFAGTFALLGGPLEMPWRFDRLFKYDVTAVFRQMHLRPDSVYHFNVHITAVNGTELDSSLFDAPSVSFVQGRSEYTLNMLFLLDCDFGVTKNSKTEFDCRRSEKRSKTHKMFCFF